MSYQVGKPLSSVQTSLSLRRRVAKTIKKKMAWEDMKQPPVHSRLQVNEHRRSMRRTPCTPENEWGENKLTTKLYVPFYTQPNILYSPSHSLVPPGSDNPKKRRKRDSVPHSWEGQQKALEWLEKEGILYRPRGSESQSLQHFFPSIFTWAFHSFWVSSYCILHGPKIVSVQRRFAPVKGCLGRLACPY